MVWLDLDYIQRDALGATKRCIITGHPNVVRFSLAVDSDTPWYTGTGTVPSGLYDVRSVLSHEFGHVTGWQGHFANSIGDGCEYNTGRHTMCPDIPAGSNWMQSLATHDIHTFQAAY